MNIKKLIIFFSVSGAVLLTALSCSLFFFNLEKNKSINSIAKYYHRSSSFLIAEKIYEDLLIQNELEVKRKLNSLIDRKIIEKYKYGTLIQHEFSQFDVCQPIFFDKIKNRNLWGHLCLKFTDEYKTKYAPNLDGLYLVLLSLIIVIFLSAIFFYRKVLNLNYHLFEEINQLLNSKSYVPSTISFWFPITNELTRLVREKEKIENELQLQAISQERIKISTQVAHDIRSPVAALKSLLENVKIQDELELKLMQQSITRIASIANDLLEFNKEASKKAKFGLLDEILDNSIQEKKIEFEVNIALTKNISVGQKAFFYEPNLRRILSNLLNNAIESGINQSEEIVVNCTTKGRIIYIDVIDKGQGIPKHVLDKLGNEEITSKENGNGIGFKHSMEILREWQGDLKVVSTGPSGTHIRIELLAEETGIKQESINNDSSLEIVLIDDDELTRATWTMKAKKAGKSLKTYKDVRSFREDLNSIPKDTELYIDSELGDFKGEILAEELHQLGFKNISIASGHPAEHFSQFSFLKSVISKKAPF